MFELWNSGPNKAAAAVGKAINVKPHFVKNMITAMGSERGSMYVKSLNSWEETFIGDAVYVFFIYQILKNPHSKNVEWWQQTLVQNGYSTDLDLGKVETAFMFLRDAGTDINQTSKFLEEYRSNYTDSPAT